MKLLLTLNPENVTQSEWENYPTREAARAVVLDADNNVALLYVANENYYKLPGGGIETGEKLPTALARECQEEIGCEVDVIDELGMIVEYRKFCQLRQVSYCFLAKLRGEKGEPEFTDEERELGFQQVWVPYEEAMELMSKNEATSLEGREYIVPRDEEFLKTKIMKPF